MAQYVICQYLDQTPIYYPNFHKSYIDYFPASNGTNNYLISEILQDIYLNFFVKYRLDIMEGNHLLLENIQSHIKMKKS